MFAIIIKYAIFGLAMSIKAPIKKGSSYRVDDLIAIFYIFFAYTLILFFKNGLFIKTIFALSYFVWWFVFLVKRQITTRVVLCFVYCAVAVCILSETIIPNYDDSLTTESLNQKIILTEILMTSMLCVGVAFILDLKDKISFFINSILAALVIYISCALLIVFASYHYAK